MLPGSQACHVYIDIRARGFYEDFYARVREGLV